MSQLLSIDIHNAGDKVFIGVVKVENDLVVSKVFGPVIVHRVGVIISQVENEELEMMIHYEIERTIHSEIDGNEGGKYQYDRYNSKYVFSTLQGAVEGANEMVKKVEEAIAKAEKDMKKG